MDHTHCQSCYSTYCSRTTCPVVYCTNGCYARMHQCKEADHVLVCPFEMVSCINVESGCSLKVARCQMAKHLSCCPAYTIICCFQWVRKMLQDHAPNHSHYIRKPKDASRQLDMALTFFDQKRGRKKLWSYIGKTGARACQEVEIGKDNFSFSYKYNPAHPSPGALRWFRTCKPQTRAAHRPPFMTPIPSFLQNCAAYKPPPPLHWTKPMYLIANKLPNNVKVHVTEKPYSIEEDEPCKLGIEHPTEEICSRVESSFSCYNVIAINNLPLLHRSEASLHMSCGQLLRRDQITAHTDVVHNRIMEGVMDGWMIQRCPLATYGCDFQQIRVRPKGGKLEVKFDEELGVFYLRNKEELPGASASYVPQLPNEIWCLIGQYCDSYTLSELCAVSSAHHTIAAQLLHSRGLAHKRWTRALAPRLYARSRKPDWGLNASLTESVEWELADVPHMSTHLACCPWNVRVEHSPQLARVFGHPIIDPSVILRNFSWN